MAKGKGHWRSSVVLFSKHITDANKLCQVLKEGLGCAGRIVYRGKSNDLVERIELQSPPERIAAFFKRRPEFLRDVAFYSGMPQEEDRLQCLLASTLVYTGTGEKVQARSLAQGVQVLAGGGCEAICVQQVRIFHKSDRDVVQLGFQTADGDEGALKVTADHPMLVTRDARGHAQAAIAREISAGMYVVGEEGNVAAKVTSVLKKVEQAYAVMVTLDNSEKTFMIADINGVGLPVLGNASCQITMRQKHGFLERICVPQHVHRQSHSAPSGSRQRTEIEKEARKLRKALEEIEALEELQARGDRLRTTCVNKIKKKGEFVRRLKGLGNP